MNKKFIVSVVSMGLFALAQTAFAHAVVKPSTAGIGAYQVFTVNVPSEKDLATTAVRLELPEGLESITPNVKPGWNVTASSTEISWTGGTIPAHMRDEFAFQVKLPASETTLAWKIYQTYSDGSMVAWVLAPGAEQPKKADGTSDFSSVGPYSTTQVVNDLAATSTPEKTFSNDKLPLIISIVALVFALWARMKKAQ